MGDDAVASTCRSFFDQDGLSSAVASRADMVGSDSWSEEALEETYDADPELRLVLQFRVSIREAGWSGEQPELCSQSCIARRRRCSMVLSLVALRRHPRRGVVPSPTFEEAQLQQALQLRNRLQQLREMRGSSSPQQVSFLPVCVAETTASKDLDLDSLYCFLLQCG